MTTILVTGGAGFIGCNFVRQWLAEEPGRVVNLDKLTYAGNLDSLADLPDEGRHIFVQGDIGDGPLVSRLLAEHRPRAIVNFAAESHVDRSIDGPAAFVETNVVGTFRLLEATRRYWGELPPEPAAAFRFRTSRPTRSTARWGPPAASPNALRAPPTRPTRPPRPPAIISCGPIITPTACPR